MYRNIQDSKLSELKRFFRIVLSTLIDYKTHGNEMK